MKSIILILQVEVSQKSVLSIANPLLFQSSKLPLYSFVALHFFSYQKKKKFFKKKITKKPLQAHSTISPERRKEKKKKGGERAKKEIEETRSTNHWSTSLLRETRIEIKEKAEKENKISRQNTETYRYDIRLRAFFAIDPWFLKTGGWWAKTTFYVARADNQTMLIRNWKDCATLEARSIRYSHVRAHTHTHTAIVLRSNKTCEIVHPRDLCVRIRWNNFISVGHARHEWNTRGVQSQTRTWRKVQFCIVSLSFPSQLPVLRDDCESVSG